MGNITPELPPGNVAAPSMFTRLRQAMEILTHHKLKIKQSKCAFAQKQLTYLGHIISHEGVATDSKNIYAVQGWPVSVNVKQVRGFLGLAGYYCRFVRNFGMLNRPLIDLLKKNVVFSWIEDKEASF